MAEFAELRDSWREAVALMTSVQPDSIEDSEQRMIWEGEIVRLTNWGTAVGLDNKQELLHSFQTDYEERKKALTLLNAIHAPFKDPLRMFVSHGLRLNGPQPPKPGGLKKLLGLGRQKAPQWEIPPPLGSKWFVVDTPNFGEFIRHTQQWTQGLEFMFPPPEDE